MADRDPERNWLYLIVSFYRNWIVATLSAAIVVLIATWLLTRDTAPREIRLATGHEGGLYYAFAEQLRGSLKHQKNIEVELIPTSGSQANQLLLLESKADLAILQAGSVSMAELAGLVPLFPDVIHVVVRKHRGITRLEDLQGKRVSIGLDQSGMRKSADQIVEHYGLAIETSDAYFKSLLTDDTLDAAIVTTGLHNTDLEEVLQSGRFDLIGILDADALALRHAHFSSFTIPRGYFAEAPPIPSDDVTTVATVAYLAVSKKASDHLVVEVLETLYATDFTRTFPTSIPRDQAAVWSIFPMHPASRNYFAPYKGIDVLANFLSALDATKELLIALGAGIYLLWKARSNLLKLRAREELNSEKEKLDALIADTLAIERDQRAQTDPAVLQRYLGEVTKTKFRGFEELTAHDIRDDPLFLVFLTQCENLSQRIRAKLPPERVVRAKRSPSKSKEKPAAKKQRNKRRQPRGEGPKSERLA